MSKKVYVKPYPKEFREQVVKLVQLGDRSALEVAREFEISVDSIRRWVQQAERDQGDAPVARFHAQLAQRGPDRSYQLLPEVRAGIQPASL